jgi:hypothetical protein
MPIAKESSVGRGNSLAAMDFIPQRTRIHRLLGAELGDVPNWICSNAPRGMSVADLLPGAIFAIGSGACSALALIVGYWILPLVALFIAATLLVAREVRALKTVERKCRARRRRHECLACGEPLGRPTADARVCEACSSQLSAAKV